MSLNFMLAGRTYLQILYFCELLRNFVVRFVMQVWEGVVLSRHSFSILLGLSWHRFSLLLRAKWRVKWAFLDLVVLVRTLHISRWQNVSSNLSLGLGLNELLLLWLNRWASLNIVFLTSSNYTFAIQHMFFEDVFSVVACPAFVADIRPD